MKVAALFKFEQNRERLASLIEYSSLKVCDNRSGKIFYKVIVSKAKTKQYFEAAKDLLCQPGRAEPTGKACLLSTQAIKPFFPQCFGKRI